MYAASATRPAQKTIGPRKKHSGIHPNKLRIFRQTLGSQPVATGADVKNK
jgi:hypothetical protein